MGLPTNIKIMRDKNESEWWIYRPLAPRVLGDNSLIKTFQIAFELGLIFKNEPVHVENKLTNFFVTLDYEGVMSELLD